MANFRALGGGMGNSYKIGPVHVNNTTDLQVVFEGLSDGLGYQILLENGTGAFTKLVKTTVGSSITLTYTVAPTYTALDGVTTTNVDANTNFYLLVF